MSVLMGIQVGTRYKKIHTGRMCAVGRDTAYRAFCSRDKGGSRGPDAGIPAFLRFFCAVLRMPWPVPCACPAFAAFRPGKEAGHEDEVQEDARGPEGQLLL